MRKNGHKGMGPFPAGRFMSPSAVSATPVVAPHSAFYCGASMSGDSLRLEAVSFESLRPGDIVAVESAPVPYVHRVIRVNGTEAVTQGDNNAAPDARPLTPGCRFSLVTGAVSFPGVFRPVAGGPQGMRRFRRNQWRRKLRAGAGNPGHSGGFRSAAVPYSGMRWFSIFTEFRLPGFPRMDRFIISAA